MNWNFLFFLGEGWFVIPWYAVGALGACYVIHDLREHNTALKTPMKWAWPVIVLFFSIIGIALYFLTARPPGVDRLQSQEEKKKARDRYEEAMWRRTNGAVIHCVAGDGFGIMTGMVIARAAGMSFWQEFWFEYLVGFVIGWLIFQRKSMTMMTESLTKQLGMGFRGEFWSMLTVMGGMGAVMAYVTPLVATSQPKPLTYAFWGFGALGLFVGFILTYPMNWMMIKVGWKHGMGGMKGAERKQVRHPWQRTGLVAAMGLLGIAGLLLPAWLVNVRHDSLAAGSGAIAPLSSANPAEAAYDGLNAVLSEATAGLEAGDGKQAAVAMDAAMRAAEAGAHSYPGSFYRALEQIRNGRLALQNGRERRSAEHLRLAATLLKRPIDFDPRILDLEDYRGAQVVNAIGAVTGKVTDTSEDSLAMELGGWLDAWGFVDFGCDRRVTVRPDAVVVGAPKAVGTTLVLFPPKQSLSDLDRCL